MTQVLRLCCAPFKMTAVVRLERGCAALVDFHFLLCDFPGVETPGSLRIPQGLKPRLILRRLRQSGLKP
jgi:hypothetical protein